LFDGFAGIVRWQGKLGDIDEVGLDAFALPSSEATSRAACRLIRPILAVPRITGMKRFRLASIDVLLFLAPYK
jgi:hypothetical protein